MIDITDVTTSDLVLLDSQVPKATNILSVQLASLEYAPTLGIDLRYFMQDALKFQNESFQSYLIEVLANRGINVASLTTNLEALFAQYLFELAPEDSSTGFLAR